MMQLPTTQRPLAVFLSLFWLFVGAGNGGKNSAIANEPKREAYKPSPEELREAYARADARLAIRPIASTKCKSRRTGIKITRAFGT